MIDDHQNGSSVRIVPITGNLDASASPRVDKELKALIGSGETKLVLDLEKVRFVDSSGLSTLVSALKAARRHGGDIVLLHLPSSVRPAIELTRLDRVFPIVADEKAARAAFLE